MANRLVSPQPRYCKQHVDYDEVHPLLCPVSSRRHSDMTMTFSQLALYTRQPLCCSCLFTVEFFYCISYPAVVGSVALQVRPCIRGKSRLWILGPITCSWRLPARAPAGILVRSRRQCSRSAKDGVQALSRSFTACTARRSARGARGNALSPICVAKNTKHLNFDPAMAPCAPRARRPRPHYREYNYNYTFAVSS